MLGFAFFGAIGHPLARIVIIEMHPLQLAVVSLLSGSVCLLAFVAASGRFPLLRRMSKKDLAASAGIGAVGFFAFQILTFSALARIPASVNAFLINTSVVYIAILAAATLGERLPPRRIAGVVLALLGVALIAFNRGFLVDGSIDMVGCLLSILGAVSFAVYSVAGKRLLNRNDPILVTTVAVLAGTVMMAALVTFSTGFGSMLSATPRAWLLASVIGITMNGLAYPLWFLSLRRLPASHVSVYLYLTPVFAVGLSYLILGETFGWLFWIGGTLILTAIVLTDPAPRRLRHGGAILPKSETRPNRPA